MRIGVKQSNETGTAADEGDEARVAMRRDCPQQRDPFVEDLRRSPQDLTARDENVKRRAATTFEKVVCALQQSYRISGAELSDSCGSDRPRIRGYAACARCKSAGEIEGCCGQLSVLKALQLARDSAAGVEKLGTVFCGATSDLCSNVEDSAQDLVVVDLGG